MRIGGKVRQGFASREKAVRRGVLLFAVAFGAFLTVLLSKAWHATQMREATLPQLQQWPLRAPENGALLALLGARLAEARDYDAASRALERAITLGEDNPDLWLTWAATEAARDNRKLAWAALMLGIQHPKDAPTLQAALDRCRKLPTTPSPLSLAAAISPAGPHSLVAHYTKGSFLNSVASWYSHLFPQRSGYTTREEWAREEPNNAYIQRLWGEALLRNGRYAEAVAVLQRAHQLAPKSLLIYRELADALYHEGEIGKAGLIYESCLKQNPNDLPSLLGLGQVALEKRILQMAIDIFQKAIKLAPNNPDAWIGLGRAYYNQQLDLGRSLQAYQQAVKLAPKRTDFYPFYADALRATSHFPEAEHLLRLRLKQAPYEAQTYYLLAVTLLDYNVTPARMQEAESDLRIALQLAAQNSLMASQLGRLLQLEGKPEQAIPFLESALQADTRDVAATIALAQACQQAGRLREAQEARQSAADLTQYLAQVKALQDAIQQHPADSTLYRRLAQLYLSGGEPDKARNYLQAAQLLEKNHERALSGLQALQKATFNTQPVNSR